MTNIFQKKKRTFLAAMVRGDLDAAQTLLAGVHTRLRDLSHLSEADEKAVNQMLAAAKKISPPDGKIDSQPLRQARASLKTALAQRVRAQVNNVGYVGYADWRKSLDLDDAQYRVMLKNVASCQLSVGCSNFCRRCNEWALAGVRRHFEYDAAQRIVRDLHAVGNERYALYCASDPLDYRCGDRTMDDLLRYMQRQGYATRFGLLTKVPRGSESLARQFLEADIDIAVSLTAKNKTRVARIEKRVGKKFNTHHDTPELMIPAGLDEDFATVKSTITDNYGIEITPEAAWMVIPTFTSALNPTGQCRLPITATSDWFIKKRVGRNALPVEYFKPLSVFGKDGSEYVLDHLLDPQIGNILLDTGDQDLTPPGMMNLAEYFRTFDPAIIAHRRKLAPVAIENLRRQVFKATRQSGSKQPSPESVFTHRKQDYLEFCDPTKVAGFKRKAFVFLLATAADYLNAHPDEREIIHHLLRAEAVALNERCTGTDQFDATVLENLFADSRINTFDSFRCLLHRLLAKPSDEELGMFLGSTPVSYNPESGRFV
ncbi:MAG: hypothetical protein GY697_08000 [Desulfobacterales bacterium]|nr:hypothetical protein [Desulfobacterales bacterium]